MCHVIHCTGNFIRKIKDEVTWKRKMMVQMRPSVIFGLPSTMSWLPMFVKGTWKQINGESNF